MSRWRILFDTPISPWISVGIGLVLLFLALAYAYRDCSRLPARWRRLILGLRIATVLVLIIVALAPRVVVQKPDPKKPPVVILMDGSESMTFEDQYTAAAAGALKSMAVTTVPAIDGTADTDGVRARREDVMAGIVGRAQFLEALQDKFEVHALIFADKTRSLSLTAGMPDTVVGKNAYSTDMGNALDHIAAAWTGDETPKAVVLLGDGSWNRGPDPVVAARMLGSRSIPVYTIAVGNPDPVRDIAVMAARVERDVILGQDVTIQVDVRGSGYGARSVPIELEFDGEIVAEKKVFLAPSGGTVTTSLTIVPQSPGEFLYIVRVPVLDDEAHKDNNETYITISVNERKIGALFVESVPRWEYRFVKHVLDRDPAVELKVYMERPGVGPTEGPDYLQELPTEKRAMLAYDLIILGDIKGSALPKKFKELVAEMVLKRGAGLVVIAGRRGGYQTWRGSPLEKILPIRLPDTFNSAASPTPTMFRPLLTDAGMRHPILQLADDPAQGVVLWNELPQVSWAAPSDGLSRGALALAVHTHRITDTGRQPLIASLRLGAGKVLFFGIEETWRWRRVIGDRYHYKLWAQTIRWMAQRRFIQDEAPVRLFTETTDARVGQPIVVEAFGVDKDGFPLETDRVYLHVRSTPDDPDTEAAPEQRIRMKPVPGGWGLYEVSIVPETSGEVTFAAVVDIYGDAPVGAPLKVTVHKPNLETRFPIANHAVMRSIADASGGVHIPIQDVDTLPAMLEAKSKARVLTWEFAFCDHFAAFLLPLFLLGAEWGIRKRHALE